MVTLATTVEAEKLPLKETKLSISARASESKNGGAVFTDGKSEITRSLEDISDPLRAELETLRGLQAMNPTKERVQQIFNLERKRKRSASFAFIQTRGTEDQKKILEKRDSFEKFRASDALFLKKKGADIANIFLVKETEPTTSVLRDSLKVQDSFVVNFGENKSINAIIGAGDILPATVIHAKINGVEGVRKNTPRPGYYNLKTGKYLPVYDDDKIEIVKVGEINENMTKDSSKAEDKWFRKNRIDDTIDSEGTALTILAEDQELSKDIQKEVENQRIRREKYKEYRPENKKKFLATFEGVVDRETAKYGIPKDLLVNNLFEKENSSFDPEKKNPAPDSTAHGFGQIIDNTWKTISSRLGTRLDRHNPEDQIIATCEYLNYIKNFKNCSWGEAIVYYHTGEGFGDDNVEKAMKNNTSIVGFMKNPANPTAHDYIAAAARYYGVTEHMRA